MEILERFPVEITFMEVQSALGMDRKSASFEVLVNELFEKAKEVARPKALYKVSYIEAKNEESIQIDGVLFKSRILQKNLENAERVFPYVVTAGRELNTIEPPKDDYMAVFCFDTIKELILESAYHYFERYILNRYKPGTMAHMNPGSLSDWPVSQQPVLFSLLGDVENLIGVRLTPSFLMDPIKSISGIYFPTEIDFKSCMLCTRHPCSKRRASYDPDMVKKYS